MPAHYSFVQRRGDRGFSFLPVAVGIAVLGATLAVGLPYGREALLRYRTKKVVSDLRLFAATFQNYASDHGDWPAGDGSPAIVPHGLEPKLSQSSWSTVSPIGGHYAWDPSSLHQGSRIRAAIVIASAADSDVTSDREQLLEIDRAIDDGDLASGNFLLGYRNYPIFVLER